MGGGDRGCGRVGLCGSMRECLCVFDRKRARERAGVGLCVRERGREGVCVWWAGISRGFLFSNFLFSSFYFFRECEQLKVDKAQLEATVQSLNSRVSTARTRL